MCPKTFPRLSPPTQGECAWRCRVAGAPHRGERGAHPRHAHQRAAHTRGALRLRHHLQRGGRRVGGRAGGVATAVTAVTHHG